MIVNDLRNTGKFIVTTTINPPGDAILEFLNKADWNLIVVGDTKTPHDEYRKLEGTYRNFTYLSPEDQDKLYPELSAVIGWRTIQRRNVGYAEAYNRGAVIIATIDDDNIPYKDWGRNLIVGRTAEIDLYDAPTYVFDPLAPTNHNYLWHRGFPIQHISTKNNVKLMGKANLYVGVQADLWDGDPDIDAIARIAWKPCVKFNVDTPYGTHVIAPFNSQNTFLIRDCFPDYCVLPFVGRMDDIFASYVLQTKRLDIHIAYNKA